MPVPCCPLPEEERQVAGRAGPGPRRDGCPGMKGSRTPGGRSATGWRLLGFPYPEDRPLKVRAAGG